MRWVIRWGAVVASSAIVFGGTWWACQRVAELDEGTALGIASAALAVFVTVAAWLAAHEQQNSGMLRSPLREVTAAGAPSGLHAVGVTPSPARPPTGRLASPRDGARVDRQEYVTGSVRELPPGTHPWIVVWPAGEHVYWPQGEFTVEKNGNFRLMAYFGRAGTADAGGFFQIRLVLADAADSGQFRAFLKAPHRGLPDLPRHVLTLDQCTVIRR